MEVKRKRNFTHKRYCSVAWMSKLFEKGDKMPDHGGIHLQSYLTKDKVFEYMRADLEFLGDPCIKRSAFSMLWNTEFNDVKIPKVLKNFFPYRISQS